MLRIMILLFLVSCGKKQSPQKFESFNEQAVPKFKVALKLTNFTETEEAKIKAAATLIEKVFQSEKFKEAILNHDPFHLNQGLSNEQIYQKLLEGSEILTSGKDYEMDLHIEGYYQDVIVVGYTYPNTQRIWMNKKFLSLYGPADVTTNMVHEWLHKLGFDHEQEWTSQRQYSVPYAVGYIVKMLAKNIKSD